MRSLGRAAFAAAWLGLAASAGAWEVGVLSPADRGDVDRALDRLAAAAASVRAEAATALGDPGSVTGGSGAARVEERVRALARAARDDPALEVRRAAVEALGRLDQGTAADALAALLVDVPAAEQTSIAEALAASVRGGAALEGAVRAEHARRAVARGRVADAAFAALLEGLGAALAERGEAALTPELHGALTAAGTSPAEDERRGAYRGLETALGRWIWLERADLAERFLADLAARGYLGVGWQVRRAAVALGEAGDAEVARAAARLVGAVTRSAAGDEHFAEIVRARIVEAAAALAAGDPRAGAAPLAAARALTAELIGLRLERHASGGRGTRGDMTAATEALRLAALVDTWDIVLELAQGRAPTDDRLRGRARELHLQLLALHVAALEGESANVGGSFDDVLDGEDAPRRLLGLDERHPRLDRSRWLGLQRALGRTLALAAPRELPGFLEPEDAGLADDPLADPERREAFHALRRAEIELVQRRLADDRANRWLWARQLELVREQQRTDETDPSGLLDYRTPSTAALALAIDLRGDGDPAASLELAVAVQGALADGRGGPLWREWTLARADLAAGAAHTDLGDARAAEVELKRAVSRLESLQGELEQRLRDLEAGSDLPALSADPNDQRRRLIEAQLELTRGFLADAFVSLAVNSNVRAKDAVTAVAWFERAFELRQGDFMVVLLACYRARVGRSDEARALLVDVPDAPPLHYNRACTHALLGDHDVALEYLARALESGVRSPGARARQKEWARDDPDLAALRGDPRFEALTAP